MGIITQQKLKANYTTKPNYARRIILSNFNLLQQDEYKGFLAKLNISLDVPLHSIDFYKDICNIFENCSDFFHKKIFLKDGYTVTLYYFNGLVNEDLLQASVIKPLLEQNLSKNTVGDAIYSNEIDKRKKWPDVISDLMNGNVICHEDEQLPLKIELSKIKERNLTDPTTEYQVYGPKIGFIEDVNSNLSILRKYIKDPRMKIKTYEIGDLTHTKVALVYVDGQIDKELLNYIESKVAQVKIDKLVHIGQLTKELIDFPLSVFPQTELTERSDKAASALLDGKLVIFADNSTFCSVVPVSLFDFYLSSGDHNFSLWSITFLRALRLICMIISTALPALYVTLVAFHPELIPTTLALQIAESRSRIPLPASFEALLMMFALDVLVEASIRLPSFVGQTIGIVGGLVIGTAVVEAGIISNTMVIVIAFTAIASFVTVSWDFVSSLRIIRYLLLFISASFGLFGFLMGFCLIFIHICHLHSFSKPYLLPVAPLKKNKLKNMFFRTKQQQ